MEQHIFNKFLNFICFRVLSPQNMQGRFPTLAQLIRVNYIKRIHVALTRRLPSYNKVLLELQIDFTLQVELADGKYLNDGKIQRTVSFGRKVLKFTVQMNIILFFIFIHRFSICKTVYLWAHSQFPERLSILCTEGHSIDQTILYIFIGRF